MISMRLSLESGFAFSGGLGGLMSTAITTSAPIARQTETGTGSTSCPSTSTRPSRSTGRNTPGMDIDARTAESRSPSRKTTFSPELRSVATAAKGMFRSSNLFATIKSASSRSTWRPVVMALAVRRVSNISFGNFFQSGSAHHASARSTVPAAINAPAIAPIDVPATQWTGTPSSLRR